MNNELKKAVDRIFENADTIAPPFRDPDTSLTGERVTTPRGSFNVTTLSREQMEAAGYGVHHRSEDREYLIMGNGTRAFAVVATPPEN